MTKSVEKTVALLRKSYAGQLTAGEQAELGRLMADERMRQLYAEIGNDEYLVQEFRRYASWLPDRGYHAFRKKRRQHKVRRIVARLSVAAGLLIALGCIWLWSERGETVEVAQTKVEPGSCRAFLQLSNGKRIALEDSAPLDLYETDGTIRIDSGKAVYSAPQSSSSEAEVYHILSVPRGGEYRLFLADGTIVHLNAGSELRYPVVFPAAERRVFLQGEAWFEVAKDAERPFYVGTEEVNIRVYGTRFNVNTHPVRSTETVLVSGEIGIAKAGSAEERRMHPGQLASYDRNSGTISLEEVDVRKYIAWKEGEFCFNDDTLEEILEELGRWYDVTIFFRSPAKKDIQFSGHLKRYEDIRKILDVMAESTGIVFEVNGRTVIVN